MRDGMWKYGLVALGVWASATVAMGQADIRSNYINSVTGAARGSLSIASGNFSLLSDTGLLYFGASSDNAIGRADASSLYVTKGLHIGGTSAVADNNLLVDGTVTVPTLYGSSADNGDLILEGTLSATKTTSYVLLQPTGGNVGIGTTEPTGAHLQVQGTGAIQGGFYNSGTNVNNYGVDGEATGAGTSNYGGYFTATGATNNYALFIPGGGPGAGANNYALYSAATAQSYFAGNVGIGLTNPDDTLSLPLAGVLGWESAVAGTNDNHIGRADASSLYVTKGLHIGGTSAVADNNLLVDGTATFSGAAVTAGSGTGVTVNSTAQSQRVVYKVTVAKEHFIAAAVTQDLTIATLPAKTRLVGIYSNISEVFALAASQLTLTCGTSAGGNQLLVAIDADAATGWFGDADGELGTSINAAARVQDAYVASFSATQIVSIRLASDSANLGNGAATSMTTGSVTFYLITEVLP